MTDPESDPKLRAAVRRFVQMIAENIDPDVTVEKVNIGRKEEKDVESL
jgi:hypothetical protein